MLLVFRAVWLESVCTLGRLHSAPLSFSGAEGFQKPWVRMVKVGKEKESLR